MQKIQLLSLFKPILPSLLFFCFFLDLQSKAFGSEIDDFELSLPPLEVPKDFRNDLWLSETYKTLQLGEDFTLTSRRVPEIVDSVISNNVAHPDYQYKIIAGDSIELEDTSSSNIRITATSLGTSIIEVSYNDTIAFGKEYGSISEVNKSYVIVDVLENLENDISIKTDITLRSYDTVYFEKGDTVDFTFNVITNADEVTVNLNGKKIETTSNRVTVALENRSNILAIEAIKDHKSRKIYEVIDARKIEIITENKSRPGQAISVGDDVVVAFHGITMPVYKLASIYNPKSPDFGGGTKTGVHYENEDLGLLTTFNYKQWKLADYNSIKFTAEKEGLYFFPEGYIYCDWWGSPLGTDKDRRDPGPPNASAPVHGDAFSIMPSFSIQVNAAN